ncbi:hypothetical protein [Micromonospora sp. NPDC048898]
MRRSTKPTTAQSSKNQPLADLPPPDARRVVDRRRTLLVRRLR